MPNLSDTSAVTTKAILVRARELISDPETHTCEAYARSREGASQHPSSKKCYAFDLLGAIQRAYLELCHPERIGADPVDGDNLNNYPAIEAIREIMTAIIGMGSLCVWNDRRETKHTDVLRALDAAIAKVA